MGHDERLHGVKGCVGERAAQTLRLIVRHVKVLLVVDLLELVMVGLDLRLGDSAEEAMTFGELQRVAQHVKLREWVLLGLRTPVLLDIIDCFTPVLDLLRSPLLLVEQMIMQLPQPTGEGGGM